MTGSGGAAHASDEPRHELIWDAILGALDAGGEADTSALLANFPQDADLISRLVPAVRHYRQQRAALQREQAPRDLLEPGARLGDFEVVSLLGTGGMGRVYVARQASLGDRLVALKVVPWRGDAAARAALRREALAMADVHHPHLVEVHGFGEHDGVLFYAMTLVRGPTLAHVIDRVHGLVWNVEHERDWQRTAVAWIEQVADALALMHASGLVHRDVKPSNIVVRDLPAAEDTRALPLRGGHALLIDFGLVKDLGRGERTVTLAGAASMAFAPQEQLLGLEVGPAADVFALGATLHDLLCRRRAGERPQASLGLEFGAEVAAGLDADLTAVVTKACEHESRWRYDHAGLLRDDLRAWLDGRDVMARRPALAERAARAARRHPRRLALIAAGALTLVVAITSVVSGLRQLGLVRDALESGQVAEFVRGARSLPWWASLLQGADVAACRAGLHREDSLLAKVARSWDLGDSKRALEDSFRALVQDGLAAQPLLARFLLDSLGDAGSANDAEDSGRRGVTAQARSVTARLFYERPAYTADELAQASAFRQRLSALWETELPRPDRDLVASAMSGCGTPADIDGLLRWALAHEPGDEGYRGGLWAVERILRRAHGCGTLGELLDAQWAPRLLAEVRQRAGDPDWLGPATPWENSAPLIGCAQAYAIACRAVGVRVDWAALLPESWIAAVEAGHGDAGLAPRLLTAAGDPRVRAWLVQVPAQAPTSSQWDWAIEWGWLCGLFGDDAVTSTARRQLAERLVDAGNASERFELGFPRGRMEREGVDVHAEVDPADRSGHPAEAPERVQLPCVREAVDGAGGKAFVAGARAEAPHWSFGAQLTQLRGGAREPVAVAVEHVHELTGAHFLAFSEIGRSTLELPFSLPVGGTAMTLRLSHQAPSRRYIPYNGLASLDIRLDEMPVAEGWVELDLSRHVSEFVLDAALLTAGEHVLTLRLAEPSTTTYWLLDVRLQPRS